MMILCLNIICLNACSVISTDPIALAEYKRNNDPFETFNRNVFSFNSILQDTVLTPLAKLYNLTPEFFRITVENFLKNINEPRNVVNAILQNNPEAAGHATGRFITNSFLGLGGLIEVSGPSNHCPKDFGGTIAKWMDRQSSYIELPVLGSSTVTDVIGILVDSLYSIPTMHTNRTRSNTVIPGTIITAGINAYAQNVRIINEIKRQSLDPYIIFRSSYRQNRNRQIFGEIYDSNSLELN